MRTLGNMTVSEGMIHLKEIANHFKLRLYVAKELKLAHRIFVVTHRNEELYY